jgi:hypothetical protein
MVVLLHGAAGGWDELAIAVAAFVVLWIAVKLAGRKPAGEDEEELTAETAADAPRPTPNSEQPSPSKLR